MNTMEGMYLIVAVDEEDEEDEAEDLEGEEDEEHCEEVESTVTRMATVHMPAIYMRHLGPTIKTKRAL